jgi:hypothetical protein
MPGVRTVFAANRRDRRRIGIGGASRGRSAGHIGMVTVFHPDPERLASLGYAPPVTYVPAIFESSGRYCREHNRYLRERSLAEWHPNLGSDIPRKRTLKNIADKPELAGPVNAIAAAQGVEPIGSTSRNDGDAGVRKRLGRDARTISDLRRSLAEREAAVVALREENARLRARLDLAEETGLVIRTPA